MPAHRHHRTFPTGASALGLLAVLAWAAGGSAMAQTVYKCTNAQGQLSFQDSPCASGDRERVLHLHVREPTPAASRAAPAASSSPAPPPTALAAPAPRAPARTYQLPQLYRCVHATDGKTYVSRNGHPRAYRAPLGIVGAFQAPLSQTYGGKDAVRRAASDPTLAHGRITPGLVAGHYTWVRDDCEPMSVPEICGYLGAQLTETESAIDKAFQSDRPPLEKKAAQLRSESAGCRR